MDTALKTGNREKRKKKKKEEDTLGELIS